MSITEIVTTSNAMGEKAAELALACVITLAMRDGNHKNRYWFLILFIIAACAAFYFLLYLYKR